MLKADHRAGRWYGRKQFKAQQRQVLERDCGVCQICNERLETRKVGLGPEAVMVFHVHHWICERFVRHFLKGANPHLLANLAAVHPSCHARATAAEKALFSGNWVGFVDAMRHIGVQPAILTGALSSLSADQEIKRARRIQQKVKEQPCH